jgi:hypothetical protein
MATARPRPAFLAAARVPPGVTPPTQTPAQAAGEFWRSAPLSCLNLVTASSAFVALETASERLVSRRMAARLQWSLLIALTYIVWKEGNGYDCLMIEPRWNTVKEKVKNEVTI